MLSAEDKANTCCLKQEQFRTKHTHIWLLKYRSNRESVRASLKKDGATYMYGLLLAASSSPSITITITMVQVYRKMGQLILVGLVLLTAPSSITITITIKLV